MFLPPANEVWGKVIFLHLSVILFTGWGLPQYMLGYHTPTPWTRHPHPPDQAPPLGLGTLGTRHPPGAEHAGRYSQPSGWDASYWNAILLHLSVILFRGGVRHPPGRSPLPLADTPPPGRHPPPKRPLQRKVRILLECILVLNMYL